MNIHEYQAKTILKRYGIPIPEFGVAKDRSEAEEVIDNLGLEEAVVKVQVHAGGRGKAGGVKFAKGRDEIVQTADKLLGLKIVNNQTGKDGIIAHEVMISKPVDIQKEYYVGMIIDRESKAPALILSPEGGMEIEEIAQKMPEKILTLPIYGSRRLKNYQYLHVAKFMGWEGDLAKQGRSFLQGIISAFFESDASLLEINPLVLTKEDQLVALDAKMAIDDNALFRQKEIAGYFDPTQVSPLEVESQKYDLAYIALDGNIGCMVNGAGLAMATMDIINFHGGIPANFLDVGGGATADKVAAGFNIILSDSKVKAILVNIFGGIMNCATIAEGIIAAAKDHKDDMVPLVVRMEGTNVDAGRKLLSESGLKIISASSLTEAAKKVVEEAAGK